MRCAIFPFLLILLLCACTGAAPEQPEGALSGGDAPPEEETAAVYTDWSKLGDREPPPEPVGSRWYKDYTGTLIPREDYGPLIPYAGLRLMDGWPAQSGCLYGLMTRDGTVVTDPVYSSVYRPGGYDESGSYTLPVLILELGGAPTSEELWDPAVYAVAAADGSWSTPFDYRAVACSNRHGLLLFRPDSVSILTPDGELQRIWTVEEMGIAQSEFDAMLSNLAWGEGWSGEWRGDYMALDWVPESDGIRCFNLSTGDIRVFSDEEWYSLVDYPIWEGKQSAVPGAEILADSLLDLDAPSLLVKTDFEDSYTVTYYREDGTPLPQLTRQGDRWYHQVGLTGGLIEVLDWNTASYYDLETLECVFRTYLNYEGD